MTELFVCDTIEILVDYFSEFPQQLELLVDMDGGVRCRRSSGYLIMVSIDNGSGVELTRSPSSHHATTAGEGEAKKRRSTNSAPLECLEQVVEVHVHPRVSHVGLGAYLLVLAVRPYLTLTSPT